MLKETLALTAIQSGILFLALWGIFRLAPAIPANAKAWMWRLAFLKPLLSLLPFAIVTLPVLRAEQPVEIISTGSTYSIQPIASPTPVEPPPVTIDPLLILWGAGVAGVAAYAFLGMRKALRITRNAQPVEDERLLQAFDALLNKADIHNKPRLLTSQRVATAMLVGGRSYAIVLPESALTQCEFEDLRLMMAHEVAHIERQDLWWFSLVSTVQSLFFFNPMVWVAVRCFRLDHESATDRHASRLAGVPIQTYADMLLRATTTARPAFAPGALPMAESYKTIHRRLEAMKHFNSKPTFWRRTSTAALAILTIGMLPAYNLVAAAVPMPEDDPFVATGQTVQVRQTKEDKEVKRLKEQVAKVQQEMRKKQIELEKLQRQLEKKSGKSTVVATTGGWAVKASKSDPFVIARAGTPVTGTTYITKPTQGRAATDPVKGTTWRTVKQGDPVKWQTVKATGGQAGVWKVDPTKEGKWETVQVSPKSRVTWKVSEAQAQGGEATKWRVVDVPQEGVTFYQISGKNLVIEQKDGVFYIKADGPISIKPAKGGNELKAGQVSITDTGTAIIRSDQNFDIQNVRGTIYGKPEAVQGTQNTKPLTAQGGTITYSGGAVTTVQGTQNTKPLTAQGTVTYSGGVTTVQGTQNSKPLTTQGTTTYRTAPLNIQGSYKGQTRSNVVYTTPITVNGNYRIVTTGKNPYNVTVSGKAKKETQKPKEKKRPSIDPLIFPPN